MALIERAPERVAELAGAANGTPLCERAGLDPTTVRQFLYHQVGPEALPAPAWGPLGATVFERTYAREVGTGAADRSGRALTRRETWAETARRVAVGNLRYAPSWTWADDEDVELFAAIYGFLAVPAGRHLWVTGTPVSRLRSNCWIASWESRTSAHFHFLASRLFEGGGVGANYSADLLALTSPVLGGIGLRVVCDRDHADYGAVADAAGAALTGSAQPGAEVISVPDTREGWVATWDRLIDISTTPGHHRVVLDVSGVRPHGAPLRTFGGQASGPAPLVTASLGIVAVLNGSIGRRLSGLEAMQIDHEIAASVIAGGSRRSARIALMHWMDPAIFDFIACKSDSTSHWSANISVEIDGAFRSAIEDGDPHATAVLDAVARGMASNGEPGFVDTDAHSADEPVGIRNVNPCLSGDTLVAVADGRGAVSIGALAEQGVDVAVYSYDPAAGTPVVRTMRAPRRTGRQVPVVRVTLDSGGALTVTPNHRFVLSDGRTVNAEDLSAGDALRGLAGAVTPEPEAALVAAGATGRRVCENCGGEVAAPEAMREISLCSPTCSAEQKTRLEAERIAGAALHPDRADGSRVISVEPAGSADVYNGTVEGLHTFFAGGVLNVNCGEASLSSRGANGESCNLGSVNLEAFGTDSTLARRAFALLARFLYRSTLHAHADPGAAEIEATNRRIGVGIMGLQGWAAAHGAKLTEIPERADLLEEMEGFRQVCRLVADDLADTLGTPRSVKVTAVAPTGTIAQLVGTTPGIHPVFARYFIRRVRFADTDPALPGLAAEGHRIVDDVYAASTRVVEFPVRDAILDRHSEELIEQSDEVSVEQFLDLIAAVQERFCGYGDGQAVSATAQIPAGSDPAELARVIHERLGRLKGFTVFPAVSRPLSPYEALSKDEFEALAGLATTGDSNDGACAGGACPIR